MKEDFSNFGIIPIDIDIQMIATNMKPFLRKISPTSSELIMVLEGSAVYHIDDQSFPVEKGDIFVVRGDYHKQISHPHQFYLCSVLYDDEKLQRIPSTYNRLKGYQQLFIQNANARLYRKEDRLQADEYLQEKLRYNLEQIRYEMKIMTDGSEQIINSMFLVLLTLISRAMGESMATYTNDNQDTFGQAVAYIQENYRKNLMMEDIAAIAGISSRHFSRKFREFYHMTPARYIQTLRINRACMLLENTNLTITEIAQRSGFEDGNYFSSCFKSVKKVSPSVYRKKSLNSD